MLIKNNNKGFTLVELAIVLVIVGLLIGGILQGQKLLLNARVTATVAQIRGIEAAVTNFRDVYGGLPGDLKNSASRVPGCEAGNDFCDEANGDGSVGDPNWDMQTYQGAGATTGGEETLLFWYSLQAAGLISGVTNEIMTATDAAAVQAAFGRTIPAAQIGGGFWAGNSLTASAGRPAAAGRYTLFGAIITLVRTPEDALSTAQRGGVTTAAIAANIDRKLDDGLPHSGTIQAYGYANACFGTAPDTPYAYQEMTETLDCGVHIRVQK